MWGSCWLPRSHTRCAHLHFGIIWKGPHEYKLPRAVAHNMQHVAKGAVMQWMYLGVFPPLRCTWAAQLLCCMLR